MFQVDGFKNKTLKTANPANYMKKRQELTNKLNKKNSNKSRNKSRIFIAVFMLILIVFFLNFDKIISALAIYGKSPKTSSVSIPVVVTKENLPQYLESNKMIKDMPKKGIVKLKLYNMNNGEKQVEESYTITGKTVKIDASNSLSNKNTNTNADIEVWINSKYISELGKNGNDLCSIIKLANSNGELKKELKISELSFLWKYKGMLKYKDCLS